MMSRVNSFEGATTRSLSQIELDLEERNRAIQAHVDALLLENAVLQDRERLYIKQIDMQNSAMDAIRRRDAEHMKHISNLTRVKENLLQREELYKRQIEMLRVIVEQPQNMPAEAALNNSEQEAPQISPSAKQGEDAILLPTGNPTAATVAPSNIVGSEATPNTPNVDALIVSTSTMGTTAHPSTGEALAAPHQIGDSEDVILSGVGSAGQRGEGIWDCPCPFVSDCHWAYRFL